MSSAKNDNLTNMFHSAWKLFQHKTPWNVFKQKTLHTILGFETTIDKKIFVHHVSIPQKLEMSLNQNNFRLSCFPFLNITAKNEKK